MKSDIKTLIDWNQRRK